VNAASLGCALLFLAPFAGVGLFAAGLGARAAGAGDWSQAGFLAIFALVFGGVGFGGAAAVLAGRRRANDELARQARQPDAPWLWRADWAARRVSDSARREMRLAWGVAAFWTLVSAPAAVLGLRAAREQGNRAALLALVFPTVGVGLLIRAVRLTLRFRRYGTSWLELGTLPAAVGHALEGTVHAPPALRPADGFVVTLSCIRRVTTGSGRSRSTSETVLWQEVRRVPGAAGEVPVAFAIPADAQPCQTPTPDDRTLWRLAVTAEVPGVDYSAVFEVPVFRTAASALPPTGDELAVAAETALPADYRQPTGSRIQVSTTRRGTEIYYPLARNPAVAAGLTAFLALWAAATWATLRLHAPPIFPLVFGGVGVLLAVAALDQWLGVTRVLVADGSVSVASGWLAPRGARTLARAEIAEVATRIGLQAGGTPYYDITVVTKSGRRVTAGRGVRDKREAEWLAATMRSALER
jgi:hypothetical protein